MMYIYFIIPFEDDILADSTFDVESTRVEQRPIFIHWIFINTQLKKLKKLVIKNESYYLFIRWWRLVRFEKFNGIFDLYKRWKLEMRCEKSVSHFHFFRIQKNITVKLWAKPRKRRRSQNIFFLAFYKTYFIIVVIDD